MGLQRNSIENLMKAYEPRNNRSVLKNIKLAGEVKRLEAPSLDLLKNEIGEKLLIKYLSLFISDIQDFFNIENKMNENQIIQTSEFILDDFQNLTIAEVSYIFQNAKKGFYGELYNRIGGQIIYQWFVKYKYGDDDEKLLREKYKLSPEAERKLQEKLKK